METMDVEELVSPLLQASAVVKPVATWVVSRGGADIYWRAQMPAKHLGAKVLIIPDKKSRGKSRKNYNYPNSSDKRGAFRWSPTEEGAFYPDIEGTVVWTRPCMVRAIHGAAMSANGHRVICEVDDNYLSPTSQNIFMRINNYNALSRLSHMQAFASMDGIICSTEWLRDEYAKTFKKELKYCPDMFVAHNQVESDDPRWAPQERTWQKLRVGIQGSDQHVHDWRLAAPALHLAKQMGCEIVFMGLDPSRHDRTWKDFLGDYTHIPWCAPEDYHKNQIPFDIGLAPLLTNRHTLGKSDIKFLEYAMSGVAIVAQNNAVYNRTIKHGETGLLAGGPDEMAYAMAALIKDARLRKRLVESARQYVMEERTIDGNLSEWSDAIQPSTM